MFSPGYRSISVNRLWRNYAKNQEFLDRLGDAEQAFAHGHAGEEQLLTAVLEGHHTEADLY
jgi:hypothetical protein